MPERPKRRKNNKNKRNKNKGNQQVGNKQNSEVNVAESVEISSAQDDSQGTLVPKHDVCNENVEVANHDSVISSPIQTESVSNTPNFPNDHNIINYDSEIKLASETICNVMQTLNEDLNNNSNQVTYTDAKKAETKQEYSEDNSKLEILPSTSNNLCSDESVIVETNTLNIQNNSTAESLNYLVEVPDKPSNKRQKISNNLKSKSLDNDDDPKIVEITDISLGPSEDDNSIAIVDSSNVLVSDIDSDVEWENTDELKKSHTMDIHEIATGTMSVTTIPLSVAQCEHTKSLTPEEEISLRKYLKTLNLSTEPENISSTEIKTEIEHIINREIKHRLRKKGMAEDFFIQRLGPPRVLDVIDEEGSSESSMTSRRQSYLSDKKSDVEDLEDDVFEDPGQSKDLKYYTKAVNVLQKKSFGRLLPQQCILVGAKLKEPDVAEARGDWTVKTIEKMTGAELVYLTDSSSSTSSVHELFEESDDGVDTDVSVRMITPTIEVTDTESLLKNTFISNSNDKFQEEDIVSQEKHDDISGIMEHVVKIDHENTSNKLINDKEGNSHEIEVLSTDNIMTDLYVKELDACVLQNLTNKDIIQTLSNNDKTDDEYALEIKELKSELNDAMNNLIKEVSSDSEIPSENYKDPFTRQDSSSSICSSQCTAKYNPTSSSLNDVSNIIHDESENNTQTMETTATNTVSHVNEVIEYVTGLAPRNIETRIRQPSTLRDSCVRKIARFPYGDKILEELASVSNRLQNITIYGKHPDTTKQSPKKERNAGQNLPLYTLPDISKINKFSSSLKQTEAPELPPPPVPPPPPIQPRVSSFKKSHEEDYRTCMATKTEPVYVCLSPSQKMLMEKTNTIYTKEDDSHAVSTHKKYNDCRAYREYTNSKEKKHANYVDSLPELPLKSQTGSRLLALIQDQNFNKNAKTSQDNSYSYSSGELERKHIPEPILKKNIDRHVSTSSANTFKPIPPPRPKKLSSSLYESDESTDFTDNSLRSVKNERKYFHFSTGSLSKEIENDVSSIQNMHRFYTNIRDGMNGDNCPRRPSLPKDLCDQQMEYIRQKEKEVAAELQRLEENNKLLAQKRGPRAPLISEKRDMEEHINNKHSLSKSYKKESILSKHPDKYSCSERGKLSSLFSSSQEEILREKMYSEYVTQMAEREERKQHKVIKISTPNVTSNNISKSMSALDILDSKVNNRIEKEFISKARERWYKLGIEDPETEDERETGKDIYKEPKVIEHKIKVIEGGEETDVQKLPSHLQEFVRFTAKEKEQGSRTAVWRPGAPTPPPAPSGERSPGAPPPPPPPPVWTPGSAGASPQTPRKSFRPVHFEETPPTRRKFASSEQNGCTSGSESEGRLRTSQSAPATGLNSLGGSSSTSRLPRAQNPTVTLLQKAREGQIPRGSANYIQQERDAARLPRDRPSPPKGDPVHALRQEYASESEDRSDYERAGVRKMADAHRKVEGIGPTTNDGMPVTLRSEVKDPSKWYKKMYDTIHKNKYDDDFVTIRYKSRRGEHQRVTPNKSHYAYFDPRSGYLSEPEGGLSRLGSSTWSDTYDSDVTTGPRRRTASVQEERRTSDITTQYMPTNKYSTLASARASQEVYRGQPGRIENYVPGKSSVVDKEAKQWWDEVMDIFDGQNISSTTSLPQASPKEKKDLTSTILSKSNMARALKESGYESDSTLVFRRREEPEAPLSPSERRAAYRGLQAGGEPPLRGFRAPAPPRVESPRRYVESDVNIHYRCPVRHDPLPLVPERELAMQQAEHMKRLYREQRRNKYLQELQDMQNRRHQDNFTPSQKAVVPLNRYDEAERVVARSLYAFNGQTPRELSFRKGDLIHVRRQIDANWYEGEIHGKVGLFPYNYVEIQKGDVVQSTKKQAVVEGRARAKFDFTAQTNLELPLKKGEVVVLTRRIDQNWWEGRNGSKTGIFPDSYVTILQEPSQSKPETKGVLNTDKPVASPAAHGLLNGSAKRSMGAHSYTPQPNSPALSNAPPATQPLPGYPAKPTQVSLTPSERGYGPPTGQGVDLNNTEPLYVDTNAEAIPYRAMYKYRPQNPDELELNEGDTVYVLEKCDDGWYVGSSQRTGRFGTFPGNYVERI